MLDAVAADRDLWQLVGGAAIDLDERMAAVRLTIQNAGRAAREELGLPQQGQARGRATPSERESDAALPHWLDNYNRQRPHSSIGERPRISRIPPRGWVRQPVARRVGCSS
jgi:transposase InsO family protein